jgi:hypothetical protein
VCNCTAYVGSITEATTPLNETEYYQFFEGLKGEGFVLQNSPSVVAEDLTSVPASGSIHNTVLVHAARNSRLCPSAAASDEQCKAPEQPDSAGDDAIAAEMITTSAAARTNKGRQPSATSMDKHDDSVAYPEEALRSRELSAEQLKELADLITSGAIGQPNE